MSDWGFEKTLGVVTAMPNVALTAPRNVGLAHANTSARMTLLDRFRGEGGRRLCVEALAAQRLVSGNRELAEDLADRAEVLAVPAGSNADLSRS
jgi:hypothetical protein